MLLKELISNINVNIGLSEQAENIEIDDCFSDNVDVVSEDNLIKIYGYDGDVTRVIAFDTKTNTISVLFVSKYCKGGTVYTMQGNIQSVIN